MFVIYSIKWNHILWKIYIWQGKVIRSFIVFQKSTKQKWEIFIPKMYPINYQFEIVFWNFWSWIFSLYCSPFCCNLIFLVYIRNALFYLVIQNVSLSNAHLNLQKCQTWIRSNIWYEKQFKWKKLTFYITKQNSRINKEKLEFEKRVWCC